VPTTILAEQHGRTFIERLADFPPWTIEVLSAAFGPPRNKRPALERLPRAGRIDVIIGNPTGPAVEKRRPCSKDLGLLVVDEEATASA